MTLHRIRSAGLPGLLAPVPPEVCEVKQAGVATLAAPLLQPQLASWRPGTLGGPCGPTLGAADCGTRGDSAAKMAQPAKKDLYTRSRMSDPSLKWLRC